MKFGSPHDDDVSDLLLYKAPLWKRTWFQFCLLALLMIALTTMVAVTLFLRPFKEQAADFDLNDLYKLESASVIYDKSKQEIGRIFVENRRPVAFDDVPFHFIQALRAAEDSRYFEHSGVDYYGIARAMVVNFRQGSVVQGGSTITQQLARNAFGLSGRSYKRKLVEAFIAIRIEEQLSKAEIMELYLNRIYFGGGFYGINAAAMGYFGKPAKELTIEESATLCGLIKSPNRLSPLRNPDQSMQARNQVFLRMRDENMISPQECIEMMRLPLKTSPRSARHESYVYEQIRLRVIDQIGYEQASAGGFQIYTTIDQNIQKVAEASLRKHLAEVEKRPEYNQQTYEQYELLVRRHKETNAGDPPPPTYLQGALIMVDNQTGAIIALLGGRDYEHSEFNRALQARRPPGTAFKPIVYATAFANGMFPGTPVSDAPIDNRRVMIGGTEGILGEWGVESMQNIHEGEITARRALVKSKVAATVRLGLEIGIEKVIATARKAGIQSPMREFPASFIGSSELLLSELVQAYTIFPNNGSQPGNLHMIEKITNSSGETVFELDPQLLSTHVDVIDPIAAFQVHNCLRGVLEEGTAERARTELGLKDFDGGGKTGTAYSFTDNWFVGYSSAVTCGVWAGFDRPQPIYRGAFSNDTVLPIWVDVMNASLEEGYAAATIAPPPGVMQLEMCDRSGKRATDGCYDRDVRNGREVSVRCTHIDYIRPGTEVSEYCPVHGGDRPPADARVSTIAIVSPGLYDTRFAAASVEPIPMQSGTILGVDPYHSIVPVVRAGALPMADGENGVSTTVVRPAQILDALEIGEEEFRVNLPPPPAIDFE